MAWASHFSGLSDRLEGHGRRSRRLCFARKSPKANIIRFSRRSGDNGFSAKTTSSTKAITGPGDYKGFKIRVPVSPLWTSMFKAFDAAPALYQLSTRSIRRSQTKIVEGQGKSAGVDCDRPSSMKCRKFLLADQPHVGTAIGFLANRRAAGKRCRRMCARSSRRTSTRAALKGPGSTPKKNSMQLSARTSRPRD